MYKLKYDELTKILIQIDPTGKETIISDDFPSKPDFSPNNKYATFLYPLEWECLGSLYLFNLDDGNISKLVSPDENQNIPKYAIWINDETIAVIIGFEYGTIAIGGNIYLYNLLTKQFKQLTNFDRGIQITKIIQENGNLECSGIEKITRKISNNSYLIKINLL